MTSTNNFDSLPNTKELWVKAGDYTFKVIYKDEAWYECIQKRDGAEIFFKCGEDGTVAEYLYLLHALAVLKAYSRISRDERIIFAGREIGYFKDTEMGDCISIQTAEEDEEGNYNIDLEQVEKDKWKEISKFFELASTLFLNFEDLTKNKGDKDD